jgi:hypothetical protein
MNETEDSTVIVADDTRDQSYMALIAEGKELSQEQKLYGLYRTRGDLSDREAAALLRIPEARVAARRNHLIEEKYPVVDTGIFKDTLTKRNVHVWGVR